MYEACLRFYDVKRKKNQNQVCMTHNQLERTANRSYTRWAINILSFREMRLVMTHSVYKTSTAPLFDF